MAASRESSESMFCALSICARALLFSRASRRLPSEIWLWALLSCASTSASSSSTSRRMRLFKSSMRPSSMVTATVSSTAPETDTEATPSMPSNRGNISPSTKSVSSCTSAPSRDTEAMDTGSMLGSICITTGAPTASSHEPRSMSSCEESSIITLFMSTPLSNSMMTRERFSDEVELMLSMPGSVANEASMGRVMSLSTCSGVAPI